MKFDELIIEPGFSGKYYWKDLWRYRELFYVLAWRDVSVRYKQTIIGLAWALIQPLLTMFVFTVIFNKIAKLPSTQGVPYELMVYAGLLPWQLFSTALTGAAGSLVGNANLISKVYFPRLIIPTAAVVVAFIDFLISFSILVFLLLWYQYPVTWNILALPFFILMAFLVSLGPGLWITSLNVKYRDFRYVIPFIVQFGLYISPVGFSSDAIPENWKAIYSLNPLVGVIDGFRWAILGDVVELNWLAMALSWLVIIIFLLLGVKKFRNLEKSFADLV